MSGRIDKIDYLNDFTNLAPQSSAEANNFLAKLVGGKTRMDANKGLSKTWKGEGLNIISLPLGHSRMDPIPPDNKPPSAADLAALFEVKVKSSPIDCSANTYEGDMVLLGLYH